MEWSDSSPTSHGTAVASLLAGELYSVSLANIINVKIQCKETTKASFIAKAIADVTEDHRHNSQAPSHGFKGPDSIAKLLAKSIPEGTSMATAVVGSVLSHFIGYEGLMRDANLIYKRLLDNSLKDVIRGLPAAPRRKKISSPLQVTPNQLVNTGIGHYEHDGALYIGAPT
ncbi:MAG: hypothetical protein Q9157_000459 [Trypethelium eluteriae]